MRDAESENGDGHPSRRLRLDELPANVTWSYARGGEPKGDGVNSVVRRAGPFGPPVCAGFGARAACHLGNALPVLPRLESPVSKALRLRSRLTWFRQSIPWRKLNRLACRPRSSGAKPSLQTQDDASDSDELKSARRETNARAAKRARGCGRRGPWLIRSARSRSSPLSGTTSRTEGISC